LSAYEDGAEVSDWAVEAMSWAVAVGLIKSDSETTMLAATGSVARAEIAVMLAYFLSDLSAK